MAGVNAQSWVPLARSVVDPKSIIIVVVGVHNDRFLKIVYY